MAKKRNPFSATDMIVTQRLARIEKVHKRRLDPKRAARPGAGAGKYGSTGEPKGPATVPDYVKIRQEQRRAQIKKLKGVGEGLNTITVPAGWEQSE